MSKFTFKKNYWLINNGLPVMIDSLQPDKRRRDKLNRILDKINGEEHRYIISPTEYFKIGFSKETKIR